MGVGYLQNLKSRGRMTKTPVRIKQDINFLENPLWFQDEKLAEANEDGYLWQDKEGFLFRAGYRPPVKTDAIFLLYLLHLSQQAGWKEEIRLHRYQIIKACGLSVNAQWYARLEDSLRRWKMVGIEFHGTFYDKNEYSTMMFGIIDSWEIDKKTKELRVFFASRYLTKVRESSYFRFIDFNQMKALRSPLATRLYEILVKNFQSRSVWAIDALKLAQKIPLNRDFASQVLVKIKPAVNRINKHTDLRVSLTIRRKSRGEIICVFEKSDPSQPATHIREVPVSRQEAPSQPSLPLQPVVSSQTTTAKRWQKPKDPQYLALLKLLPWERQGQRSLQEAIWKAFQKFGAEYVTWNIRYANKRAIGNYPAYLQKALNENYGLVLREEEEIKALATQQRLENRQARVVAITTRQANEQSDADRAQAYISALSDEARRELESEAIQQMPIFLRRRLEQQGRDKSISFQAMLRQVALEKLRAKEAAAADQILPSV